MKGLASMAALAGVSPDTAQGAIPRSDVVSVGSGSYTTALPDDGDITADYATPPSSEEVYTTANASGPIPTNDWWTSIILGTNDDPHGRGAVVGLPYYAEANTRGLTVQYPSDWFGDPAEQGFLKMDYLNTPQLTIGNAATDYAESAADDWGDWHVRARWGDGTATAMDVTMARGCPLFFVEYNGGDAELTFETKDSTPSNVVPVDDANISVWADRGNVLGVSVDGITADDYTKQYGIFAPADATWTGTGTSTLTSSLDGDGYLTVALLPDAGSDVLDLFETYAYNVIRDTSVEWNYVKTDADRTPISSVRSTFSFRTEAKAENTAGDNEVLTCLFPHQWKHSSDPLTDYTYFSPRGTLKLFAGSSFDTTMTYPGILPFLSDEGNYDTATLSAYLDRLASNSLWQNGSGSETNTYWAGKDYNRNWQAIPIAQQVGNTTARDHFLNGIADKLSGWLTVEDTSYDTVEEEELFYYHDAVGSLIGYPDGFGSASILNDHHFHYGYFVNAAAEIARMDDEWVSEYEGMVNLLIRDYANWERPDGTDPFGSLPKDAPKDAFPFMRNFDPYGGHSFAGGDAAAADGNNQESSSEAVNAYAGMIKWAELTGNTAMRDAAIAAYTHEVTAIWEYWFDPSHDSFPTSWGDDVSSGTACDDATPPWGAPEFDYASIVWSTGYDHHVFWGPLDTIEVFGINWLPINGHSLYLGWDQTYARENWDDMTRTRGLETTCKPDVDAPDTDFLDGWKTAAWGYRSLHDAGDAVGLMESELPLADSSGSGSSTAFTYHWVYNMDAMGTVDPSVVADVPMYAVFDDGTEKTYIAYNASDSTRTVTFSDGFSMDVPANAQKSSNGSVTPELAPRSDMET
ncbi:glycosyl hydrolase [Halocatena salina]|uniref:glucan endo-1,3-beta-D-glucosidase n=1 Tax=Halocatena salina TaxID=2934340 RepID=A0A8U0A5V8_9EURY|nr:glycosyl hydrolase [Halocatena salina]UPM44561.1 glycosyl hydrolase [Halocatena salina]